MNEFDRMMKENADKLNIPNEFSHKVDDVLNSLPERELSNNNRKNNAHRRWYMAAAVIALLGVFLGTLSVGANRANANIFEKFKMTLMDIFDFGGDRRDDRATDEKSPNMEPDKNYDDSLSDNPDNPGIESGEVDTKGVESKQENAVAKPDLMIELQETIVDTNGIYALLQITAPSDVELSSDISFDYYGFCRGSNYNADNLIGGAVTCYYLDSLEARPNAALYVMQLTGDVSEYEGEIVAACMKDLTLRPDSDDSNLLIEGMWSVSFMAEKTVRDGIEITGAESLTFPYIHSTASIVEISLTPLGISLTADVSNIPFEELGVSDTTISLKLLMRDGSEYIAAPYEDSEFYIVDSGESEFDQVDGISYQKDIYSFKDVIDVNEVAGFYVQGVFVPGK